MTQRRIEKLEIPTEDELFREVDPSYRGRTVQTGPAAAPTLPAQVPVPVPPKPLTDKQRESFRTLCAKKFQLDEELLEVQRSVERVKDRITQIVRRRGVVVRQQDRVLFSAPYKAQLEQRGAGEFFDQDLVLDWAREALPEVVQVHTERTLDVEAVERAIREGAIPRHVLPALQAVLKAAQPIGALQENRTEMLNHEAFEKARQAQQVPRYLLDAARKTQEGHFALTLRVLPGKARCGGCGLKHPKRKVPAVCKRCGFQG